MNTFRFITIFSTALILAACKPLNWTNQIAVVNLNTVAQELGRNDTITRDVQTANNKLNTQLEQIAKDLQTQIDTEKSKLGKTPNKEEEEKFIQLVQQANNQLNQTKQVALQKSQQFQNSLVAEFRKEVSEVAKQIAQKNGYQTVLAVDDSLLWSDESIDITKEVVTEMRYSVYRDASKEQAATTTEK